MNAAEVVEFVIQRWRDGHTVEAIRVQLICLGCALMTKERILAAIKIYCDCNGENAKLGKRTSG